MSDQEALPIIFEHCTSVYNEMNKRATPGVEIEQGTTGTVYEGYLTKLFDDLRLSVPYYTTVMAELKRMGCVLQLRRGGGNSPSQWLLQRPPTKEHYLFGAPARKTKQGKEQALNQRLDDMNRRLLLVEDRVFPTRQEVS